VLGLAQRGEDTKVSTVSRNVGSTRVGLVDLGTTLASACTG
jgi:hypothetical protein